MQLLAFEEYGEEDSTELRGRLEEIRVEMEYPCSAHMVEGRHSWFWTISSLGIWSLRLCKGLNIFKILYKSTLTPDATQLVWSHS